MHQQLARRLGVEPFVGAQKMQELGEVALEPGLLDDPVHLGADALDFGQPALVNRFRGGIQRGVMAHQGAVISRPSGTSEMPMDSRGSARYSVRKNSSRRDRPASPAPRRSARHAGAARRRVWPPARPGDPRTAPAAGSRPAALQQWIRAARSPPRRRRPAVRNRRRCRATIQRRCCARKSGKVSSRASQARACSMVRGRVELATPSGMLKNPESLTNGMRSGSKRRQRHVRAQHVVEHGVADRIASGQRLGVDAFQAQESALGPRARSTASNEASGQRAAGSRSPWRPARIGSCCALRQAS